MKPDPPSKDLKLQLLQEIAADSGIEWNSKALENKLFNDSVKQQVNHVLLVFFLNLRLYDLFVLQENE